jgi:hypothetical protein
MNTFLKILLVAIILLVALKFSPFIFLGVLVGMGLAVVLGAVGLSLVAALLGVVIGVAVALSPIWIPVLIIMGLISLFRRTQSTPTSTPTPPAIAA